jgi:hypothetical protein
LFKYQVFIVACKSPLTVNIADLINQLWLIAVLPATRQGEQGEAAKLHWFSVRFVSGMSVQY